MALFMKVVSSSRMGAGAGFDRLLGVWFCAVAAETINIRAAQAAMPRQIVPKLMFSPSGVFHQARACCMWNACLAARANTAADVLESSPARPVGAGEVAPAKPAEREPGRVKQKQKSGEGTSN